MAENVNTNKFKMIWFLLFLNYLEFSYGSCYRKPQGAIGDRSPVDESYQIHIDGNPTAYIPGQQYNITLSSANGLKFISFTLLVEADNSAALLNSASGGGKAALGHFEIIDNAETRFSSLCENMIESSNTNTKNRIDVGWAAPSDPASGCVLFKAAILQHRDVWFIDDGFLTKRLCPEEIDEINSQTPPVNPCCACDEAKYEIILERKWRRNTHAKDFPSEPWRTKLGEVVGASHSLDYRFWEYGGRASQGLQELAEHGATKTLENEIKQQMRTGSIRTIIKAPGIKYRPNFIGKTLATVRVGPSHHVISLVFKIDPSPDWILGVAGLELCLANCTWIEEKLLNLYPWDVGTDAGASYMSPDQAQYPPDVIRRISSTFPSDYRSPFYDKAGAPMKPLATLHVTRKRTYERECDFEEPVALECSTHPWSTWSECSAKCGAGTQYRLRAYKDAKVAENFNCNVVLRQNQNCIGTECGLQQAELPSAECELTNWSSWSECSKKCGKGLQTRTRDYSNPYAREKCQAGVAVELKQTRSCNGENCGGNIFTPAYEANDNDMFEQNFDEEQQANQNVFKPTKFHRKSFGKSQQPTKWRPSDSQEEPANSNGSNGLDNDMNAYDENSDLESQAPSPFDDHESEETEDVKNIYGNEKLVGGNSRRLFKQDRMDKTKLFGDLDTSLDEANNKNYGSHKENIRPGFGTSRHTYQNSRNPFGFRTFESEEQDQKKNNFCLEKPAAPSRPCNKRRPIVKNYWFFDADDGECKLFTADNCDENQNKFLSMEKCLEACSGSIMQDNQDINSFNRARYNSRGLGITTQSTFRARWY